MSLLQAWLTCVWLVMALVGLSPTIAEHSSSAVVGTVYFDPTTETARIAIGVNDTEHGDAVVGYSPTLFSDGWDRLSVSARGTSRSAAFSAGFAEGFVSQKSIFHTYTNSYASWFADQGATSKFTPASVFAWLKENYNWTKAQAADANSRRDHDAAVYWAWVQTTLDQLDGLVVGYNEAAPSNEKLNLNDFLLLNADGDVESLQDALKDPLAPVKQGPRKMRCSSMWKLADDNSDIYFGHATWDSFTMMVRTLKTYTWGAANQQSAVAVTMSSSPGFLSSVDDFYLTSKGLAVIETTNGNMNSTLWELLTPQSVLSWVRVNVANAAAQSAPEWTTLFSIQNSGTYNNQWMVLDMNLFQPGQPLPSSSFLILEQMPGACVVEDKSAYLNSQRYWGSYNIPAIPSVWKATGFATQLPSWEWSHSDCPRAQMMARLNGTVQDLGSFQSLIRYNEFGRDSNVHDAAAGYGISSRFDLIPKTQKEFALFGGIDSKASSVQMASKGLSFWAQNGPTHDNQPPFDWSAVPFPNPAAKSPPVHVGMPDKWDFDWVLYGTQSL